MRSGSQNTVDPHSEQKWKIMSFPVSGFRVKVFEAPLTTVTALCSKNAAMLNKLPVRRRQSRQWHIETRTSPWQLSRSLPQVQLAKRSVTRHKLSLHGVAARGPAGSKRRFRSRVAQREIDQRKGGAHPRPSRGRGAIPTRLAALTGWRSKLECPKRRTA